jgi:hypothetical protein
MTRPLPARRVRGLSLLEVMIAMAILMVGLLGMMHFQIVGITGNNGGRMHTVAAELAQELVSGIERLQFGDPVLTPTGSSGPTAPTPFGTVLDGSGAVVTGAHEWSDASPVPGVRPSSEIPPEFERRWTVWAYSPTPGAQPAAKLVAVSVVYQEPAVRLRREVVRYTQLADVGTVLFNITANQ